METTERQLLIEFYSSLRLTRMDSLDEIFT